MNSKKIMQFPSNFYKQGNCPKRRFRILLPRGHISLFYMRRCTLISSSQAVLDHLLSALVFPKDKLARSNLWTFTSSNRFYKDFVRNYKFSVRLRLLGFSINPEVVPGSVYALLVGVM
jgi:hypothetical protein